MFSSQSGQEGLSSGNSLVALVVFSAARGVAHQFVVLLILGRRPDHLPDIETGRLQVEHELVESDPRSRVHFRIGNRNGQLQVIAIRPMEPLLDLQLGAVRRLEDEADAALLVPNCPVCHQTVSLIARHLEANGIATVVMGCAKDIVEHCGAPRFLFSDFPLGNGAGRPHDPESQALTIELALRLPNVIVSRSLSKAYGLAGVRFGLSVEICPAGWFGAPRRRHPSGRGGREGVLCGYLSVFY